MYTLGTSLNQSGLNTRWQLDGDGIVHVGFVVSINQA